jgi:protein-S-isoprenylcysteine O-methyltransferase Ste14
VRHPYYLANYLIDTAFCLLSGNSYLLLAYPFLFFWSYGPTFRKEETALKGRHGKRTVD